MTRVQLRRVGEAQNMRRFYSLALQPDLWGGWWLVREHGRIGSPGRVIQTPSPIEAQAALEAKRREKEKGGYLTS